MKTPLRRLSLLLMLVGALGALLAPAAAIAKKRKPPALRVKILGFTTYSRLPGVAIQVKPGKKLTQCYNGYNGQREVNFVWQGKGIPKGTKVAVALWGGGPNSPFAAEPSDADVAKAAFKWKYKVTQTHQSAYGFSLAGGPYGPEDIDGTWTAKVLVKGKVKARGSVTIACAT